MTASFNSLVAVLTWSCVALGSSFTTLPASNLSWTALSSGSAAFNWPTDSALWIALFNSVLSANLSNWALVSFIAFVAASNFSGDGIEFEVSLLLFDQLLLVNFHHIHKLV